MHFEKQNQLNFQLLFGLVLLTMRIGGSSAESVRFYEHRDHQGSSIRQSVFGSNCVNLPHVWNDRISSINTEGNCIIIFEHGGCSGSSEALYPGTFNHDDLGGIGWNDKISSFKLCH
ncbi:unnamed protein product [Orchesella dallaii]|uniref:Beta/gamma crystallin 'Greek key' domain-containing protein n=1 Tax=Orchesella dallaii TaxID=48710 RepID=A0ABP1S513_9HEXA